MSDIKTTPSAEKLLKIAMAEVITAKNPALMAECIDLVFGLRITGKTQAQLADEHGMTRANVSAICRALEATYITGEKPKIKAMSAAAKAPRKKREREPWGFRDIMMKRLGGAR